MKFWDKTKGAPSITFFLTVVRKIPIENRTGFMVNLEISTVCVLSMKKLERDEKIIGLNAQAVVSVNPPTPGV